MSRQQKTEWHPAAYSAIRLELIVNKTDLKYNQELELTAKPIRTDMVIIKKNPGVKVENPIGHIFKEHNIIEYKSPEDALNIDTFYKAVAYAIFYKINTTKVNEIKADDMTITFIREGKPKKLINQLKELDMDVEVKEPGIYYVKSQLFKHIQIIATKELDNEKNIWITSLTKNIDEDHLKRILIKAKALKDNDDRECVSALMEVIFKENRQAFKTKEANMFDSFKELMKPEFEKAEARGRAEGEARGEARGITKGVNLLGKILLALNEGRTKTQLLEDGYSEALINQAEQIINTLRKNK